MPEIADDPKAHHAAVWRKFRVAAPDLQAAWHKVKTHHDFAAAFEAGDVDHWLGNERADALAKRRASLDRVETRTDASFGLLDQN